jgi:putative ABC transport system permease protein
MKKWLEPLTTAWVGVVTHKLRSFLTMLGIVIGVAAVISLMAVGKGATADILANIESMGSDLITISPGAAVGPGGFRGAMGSVTTLTQEDAEAIAEQVDYIKAVAPYSSSNLQLVYGDENMNAQIMGVTTAYREVMNLELASGSFISDYDYRLGSMVAVIGADVAETLFTNTDPVGQQMRMGSLVVRVIGVLESDDSMTSSTNSTVIIPLTVMQQTISQERTTSGDHIVSSIALTVTDEEQAEYVEGEITSLLRARHRLSATDSDDFYIQSVQEIAETVTEASGTMTILLGAIAAISLLVGGIGVMNIMLVSVLERTREIGIRKALGARDHDIWIQFLVEAALLTLAGGIIGVAAGWLVAYFVDSMGLMTTLVTADIVILAVSVSVGIGLFFGFYPAWNASRLNPIEALRAE